MKKFAAAALVALSFASAAHAQDTADLSGFRVGAEVGVIDDNFLGTGTGSYGIHAGYDFDLGKTVVGVTANVTKPFDDEGTGLREFAIGGRFGAKAAPRTLAYASAAYSNVDADGLSGSLDGVRFGLGVEQSFGKNAYINLETRYGNYEQDVDLYQTVLGLGVRF